MKKALIAAAVAGAFAAPSVMAAELSTNVYWSTAITMGETTTTAADGTSTAEDRGEVQDGGGNRLMFTWTDTLDNGIGVNAVLSFGSLDTAGLGAVNVRNANIGFSGDFGKIQVGTNEHFTETDLIFDPSYADFGNGGGSIYSINMGQSGFNFLRRDGESVWFTSNDMNGVQLRAAYIFGSQNQTAAADPEGTQIGLSYTSGALRLGINQATYNDYSANGGGNDGVSSDAIKNKAASAAVQGSEAQMTTLLASYDLGVVNVKAAQWTIDQSGVAVTTSTADTATAFEVTGRSLFIGMPVGGGTLWVETSSLSDQDATVAGVTSAINQSGKSGWDVGYHHAMNSQVNFFVRYGVSETEINFNNDFDADGNDGANTATEISEFLVGWQLMY